MKTDFGKIKVINTNKTLKVSDIKDNKCELKSFIHTFTVSIFTVCMYCALQSVYFTLYATKCIL